MNTMRKIVGFLMAVMLAAFAVPASADSGDTFSLAVSPLSPIAQAGPITFTATIKMLAKYDYLKSYTITVPTGLTISGTPTASAGTVSAAGQVVSGSGVAIPGNKTVTVTIKATPSPTFACGTNPSLIWTATGKGGLLVNNEVFTLDPATAPRTTKITPLCYTVTGAPSAGGSVTCASPVNAGGSSNCSLVGPNNGYTFAGFSTDTNTCTPPTQGATTCTVSNVVAPVVVSAMFNQIPYSITGVASPAAGGTVKCVMSSVTYGQSSTCTATPGRHGLHLRWLQHRHQHLHPVGPGIEYMHGERRNGIRDRHGHLRRERHRERESRGRRYGELRIPGHLWSEQPVHGECRL